MLQIHGYHLGYKQKQHSPNISNANAAVDQVSDQSLPNLSSDQDSGQTGRFLKTLNNIQYQQLMTMFSNHLVSHVKDNEPPKVPSTSHTTGSCYSITTNPHFDSMNHWIMDYGAFKHTCSNANLFISFKHIRHSTVSLRKKDSISVCLCGDIKLSP